MTTGDRPRSWPPSRVVLAAALAWPASLGAQEVGTVAGLIVDQANLQPLEGVLVKLHDQSARTRTDPEGRFSLSVPAGDVILKIEREGYATLVEPFEVAPSEESLIQFRLHRVTALLDEMLVDVPPSQEGRAEQPRGARPAEEARTAADLLLRGVPGLSVRRTEGAAGAALVVHLRGVSSISLSDRPAIYLDGVQINAGDGPLAVNALDQIPAASVQRIRVLRGPASTSMYPNSAAGVILIETGGRRRNPGR